MIFTILLSFAFASQEHIVLYPGQSQDIAISSGGKIEIESRGILKATDRGSKLHLVAQKKGETVIKTQKQSYKVTVLDKENVSAYHALKQWQVGKIGPSVEVVDRQIEIRGKILTFIDWLELNDYHIMQSDFIITAKISPDIQQKINLHLKELSQKNNLPYSSLNLSPYWHVSLAESEKAHLPQYKKLLSPLGIQANPSPYALNSSPMVEVNIMATEIRRSQVEKLGIDWPTEAKANLVPSLTFNAESLFVNVKAFEQNGTGRVLASPTLIAKSGESATFVSGGEIPMKITSRMAGHVEWKSYGIVLKIKPIADYTGKMTIEVECEVSMLDESVKIDGIPGLITNKISSRFHLNESKTIALSGLIKEEWSRNKQGLNGLSRIPILDKLFGSEDFKNNQSELFFFVTPKIIY